MMLNMIGCSNYGAVTANCAALAQPAIGEHPPAGQSALHWRLLTSLAAPTATEASEIVRLYRLLWRIGPTFRVLKSDRLGLGETQTTEPHRLFDLAAVATAAAVRIIQFVDARDGCSRPASDVVTEAQITAATILGPSWKASPCDSEILTKPDRSPA